MGWKRYNAERAFDIPGKSGLYAIFLDGRLAYIGISTNIRSRFKQHGLAKASIDGLWKRARFERMTFKARVVRAHVCELEAIERRLIARLKPFLNVTYGPAPRNCASSVTAVHRAPKDAPHNVLRLIESEAQALAVSIASGNHKLDYIAACIGKSRGYVSRMQSGERPIPSKLIGPLCAATGTNLLNQFIRLQSALGEVCEVERLADMLRQAA